MTTAYTSLLGLALPVTGELSGTWGDTVNNSITSLLDSAVAGTTTLSTDADVTLTTTTGAANTAREAILLCSGARTGIKTITAPAQSKIYTVINATTGGYSVKVVGAGPTTGVTIVAGESAVIAWNGSDFIKISNTAGAATVSDLTVTSSATLSYGTANGVAYLNGSKVLTTGTALTFDGAAFTSTGTQGILSTVGGNSARMIATAVATYFGSTTAADVVFQQNSTEGMRLTSTGLGIGTSSPGAKLEVNGSFTTTADASGLTTVGRFSSGYAWSLIRPSSTATGIEFRTNAGDALYQLDQSSGANKHIWYTGASEQMRLTSTGLGIGTTTPNKGSWSKAVTLEGSGNEGYELVTNGTYMGVFAAGGSTVAIGSVASVPLTFQTGATERMRIDTSGNLLVGTTGRVSVERFTSFATGDAQSAAFKNDSATRDTQVVWNAATSGNNSFVTFYTETSITSRGGITYNRGAGLVAYNVTSDYRAKDIIGPVVDSGALIDSVPVYMGKMKGATQERPMFIAHETPAYAHTGVKDAVDADGNPVYQQMDASALVPVMWAEIQSLRKRLAALEAK